MSILMFDLIRSDSIIAQLDSALDGKT